MMRRLLEYWNPRIKGDSNAPFARGPLVLSGVAAIPILISITGLLTHGVDLFLVILLVFPSLIVAIGLELISVIWSVILFRRTKRLHQLLYDLSGCALVVAAILYVAVFISRHGGGAPGGF